MLRALAVIGPVVEALAVAQQLRWHAAHPDIEPFDNLLLAHSGIYVGAIFGALGAGAWVVARPRWRLAAGVVLAAALVRIGAVAADALAHATGGAAEPAHRAYSVGIYLAAVGFALALLVTVRAARRGPATR